MAKIEFSGLTFDDVCDLIRRGKRTTITWKEIYDAQERVLDRYNECHMLTDADIQRALGLPVDDCGRERLLIDCDENASQGWIRELVLQEAHKHFLNIAEPIQPYWRCDDKDSVIPEAHIYYEHAGEPIAKITRAPHISCDDVVMPHYGESFDNLNKNLKFKESKFMNKINNVCGGSLIFDEAEKKLQKKFQEDGWLTRKDVWDALNVRVADARNYGKQKLTDIDSIHAAAKEIMDHCYMLNKLPFGLEPLKMWQTDNGYTTVEWSDGTTTSVSTEDDGHATPYGGFCACVVKKLYGSTGRAIKMMEHADGNAKWPAEKKRIEREKIKKIRQANAEMHQEKEKKRREHMIEMHMEGIYAQREAERRIAEADEKKVYEP